eukprot:COSAG01_NODE_513_length_16049_cov_57.758056_4_plen_85_part_00
MVPPESTWLSSTYFHISLLIKWVQIMCRGRQCVPIGRKMAFITVVRVARLMHQCTGQRQDPHMHDSFGSLLSMLNLSVPVARRQ